MPDPTPPTGFQTQTQLQRLLSEADIRPRRRYGQNFLIDRNLLRKLVESAELCESDVILEVGAGAGSLTAELAARAGRVIAAEIDPRLARVAEQYLAGCSNVMVLRGDALRSKSAVSAELESVVRAAADGPGRTLKLVANLPYDTATPLLLNLLVGDLPFRRFCFTVQAEVADRFLAGHGTAAFGPVSIVAQHLCILHRVSRVPPQAFWPAPKVESAMLRFDVRPDMDWPSSERMAFSAFVRGFFLHRRKTMAHSLRRMESPDRLQRAMESVHLDAALRPEQISTREWVDFFIAAR